MPVNLSIKGVPDPVAASLRARAARNHRSLQRELMAIIEVAAAAPEPSRGGDLAAARRVAPVGTADRAATPLRPIEEIFEEWRKLFPRVRKCGPSGTEIIRKMRDGRSGETSARETRRAGSR